MKRLALTLVLLVCFVTILASAIDLRCGAVAASNNTVVVICRASRL